MDEFLTYPDFTPEYKANCHRDREFQPLGKNNAETIWQNADKSIIVTHYWHKYTDPLTADSFPYKEIWNVYAKLGCLRGSLSYEAEWLHSKKDAITLAETIYNNDSRFNIKYDWLIKKYTITLDQSKDEPLTETYLLKKGFVPDKMGDLTLGPLHIGKKFDYIRSYPIPKLQTAQQLEQLLILLGIKTCPQQ